jgi:hypothetical protein
LYWPWKLRLWIGINFRVFLLVIVTVLQNHD